MSTVPCLLLCGPTMMLAAGKLLCCCVRAQVNFSLSVRRQIFMREDGCFLKALKCKRTWANNWKVSKNGPDYSGACSKIPALDVQGRGNAVLLRAHKFFSLNAQQHVNARRLFPSRSNFDFALKHLVNGSTARQRTGNAPRPFSDLHERLHCCTSGSRGSKLL